MKSLFVSFLLFASSLSFATEGPIRESDYEARHQKAIVQGVYELCGLYGVLIQKSSTVKKARIDQGIVDYYYSTKFELRVGIDQYLYDEYSVTVESAIYSAYDHKAKDWGQIEVLSANCDYISQH